jgi:hypothetical protein
VATPEPNGSTPEWRRALRDIASIATGVFLLVNEALTEPPNETRMYIGALLLVGPVAFRSLFGK